MNGVERFCTKRKVATQHAFRFIGTRWFVVLSDVLLDVFIECVAKSRSSERVAELDMSETFSGILACLGERDLREATKRPPVAVLEENEGLCPTLRNAKPKAGKVVVPVVALTVLGGF